MQRLRGAPLDLRTRSRATLELIAACVVFEARELADEGEIPLAHRPVTLLGDDDLGLALCLMKSDALAAGTVVRFEDRVQNMFELLSYPQERLLMYLYPRLFALHSLPSERCGEYKIGDDDTDPDAP